MSASAPSLLLLIPAYNEENRIGPVLNQYAEYFGRHYPGKFGLVVVLNGCRDDTMGVVQEAEKHHPCITHSEFPAAIGKGGALIEGLKLAPLADLIGYVDADGYVYIHDRVKDMIVSGGENVYSVEVEQAVAKHPAVAACAVIGVPDDAWGERVHAVVVLRSGAEASDEDIRTHCKTLIGGYKCPRSVEFIAALPVNGAGKVCHSMLDANYSPAFSMVDILSNVAELLAELLAR